MAGKYLLEGLLNGLHGEIASTALTVSGAGTFLPPAPLQGRKTLLIYNNHDSQNLWVGASGISDLTGVPVPPGSSISLPVSRSQVWGATTTSGAADVRVDVRLVEIA